jgi:hypothetical protein
MYNQLMPSVKAKIVLSIPILFAILTSFLYVRFPLQSDDPQFYFMNIYKAKGSFLELIKYSVAEGFTQGHSNFIGVTLSNGIGFFHYRISSALNSPPWIIHGLLRSSMLTTTFILLIKLYKQLFMKDDLRIRLILFFVFFGTLQIHSPWSHDYAVSSPAAGLLTPLIMIFQLLLILKIKSGKKIKYHLILLYVNSLFSVFIYEIHLLTALLPTFFYAFNVFANKNRTKANLNLIYVSVTSILTWIVARSLFSQNELNYSGTQFAPLRDILQTLKLNILGSFPSAAWNLSELFISTKFFGPLPAILPTLFGCAFGIFLVQYFKFNLSKELIFSSFIVIFLWIGSAILHSLSIKNVNEISQLGIVYFSYGVGFVSISFAISVVLIWVSFKYSRSNILKLSMPFIIFFSITFFVIQNFINLQLLNKQIQDYNKYEALINSTVRPDLKETKRCQIFFDWKPNFDYSTDYQNDYYLKHILKGLDEITMKEQKEMYCSLLYNS